MVLRFPGGRRSTEQCGIYPYVLVTHHAGVLVFVRHIAQPCYSHAPFFQAFFLTHNVPRYLRFDHLCIRPRKLTPVDSCFL